MSGGIINAIDLTVTVIVIMSSFEQIVVCLFTPIFIVIILNVIDNIDFIDTIDIIDANIVINSLVIAINSLVIFCCYCFSEYGVDFIVCISVCAYLIVLLMDCFY